MMNRVGLCLAALAASAALASCGEKAGDAATAPAEPAAAPAAPAAPMSASFADPAWNGQKVPDKQWCQKFGGSGATPALTLANVPAGTSAVVLAFNDETYEAMNNGGHGAVRFAVTPTNGAVSLPSVPGETDALPAGVTTEKAHLASDYSGTGGAYLPPCSGGKGNTYTATVTALGAGDAKLGETRIVLGTY
jgi:hypothetical protein